MLDSYLSCSASFATMIYMDYFGEVGRPSSPGANDAGMGEGYDRF